ncbi:hypothetical protein J31TS4_34300 [Paenibacillus sp. J31TS4]|uniref:YhgE/Pip domain-containing protein n=1 Tax=Paenibacillus sp. J31TS4 TaxID=2807195 RepID=UPI001B29ED84|nr:YhgE/Pip domain-containing protein [Paenibacillus sp. J31TS4]GIP40150.1 hypothetical protein J31TS4_34300 [Paenibacillus sp. J31TS4]
MRKSLKQFGMELASIARNRKVLISVIAVLMVPVLYTAMFLEAFWDPYAKMDTLPVAVVNTDRGTEFNGKSLTVGKQFVDKLKEDPQFDWRFVSEEEALQGMKDNKYYMTIKIPEDFSEKTTTLTSDHPSPAQLAYLPNESLNFLASQIGNTAVEKMKEALNKEVTEVYARTVFEQMEQLVDGIGQASEGAGKLADGTAKAKDGAVQIEENLSKLVAGSLTLKDGVGMLEAGGGKLDQGGAELNAGAGKLADGLKQLTAAQQELGAGVASLGQGAQSVHTGAQSLSGGLSQLAQGGQQLAGSSTQAEQAAKKLAAGLGQSAAGAAQLEEKAAQLSQGLQGLAQKNAELAQDPDFQALLAGSKQLAGGMSQAKAAQTELSKGAGQLSQGMTQLSGGLSTIGGKLSEAAAGGSQLAAGSQQVADGAGKVSAGMTQFGAKLAEARDGGVALAGGAQQLAGGAKELHQGLSQLRASIDPFVSGSQQLKDGAQQVASGLLQLNDGSQELSGKLSEATDKTSGLKVSDPMYDMFAAPVQSDVQKVNEVPNYGTGFAPYFLSLGLYVGALVLTIVYSVREPAVRPTSGWSWFWSKALTLVTAGTIQALVADAALLFLLDLHVSSVPMFLLFSVVTSITFMMLIQFLVTTLQNPGRFLAIVILIFQLTSSAGTFPLELIPSWLQKFTPWLPMTYSVAGLKAVISSGDTDAMWKYMGILGVFAVIFAAITLTYFLVVHRKTKPNKQTAIA